MKKNANWRTGPAWPAASAASMVITAASVAAQVAGVAPGGVGTYEAAAVAAYVALGFAAGPALAAAVIAHGLTMVYSLASGAVAVAAPGWARLARRGEREIMTELA